MSDSKAAMDKWVSELGPSAWIGVDLDGTWAMHGTWRGELHIGEPIARMTERVKAWLAAGVQVRVMTARAQRSYEHGGEPNPDVINAIQDWTEKVVGKRLRVTNEKDYGMIQLWDDRAVQVIVNTGMRADGED